MHHLWIFELLTAAGLLILSGNVLLSDVDTELDALIKRSILDSLADAHITTKEACALTRIDQSQWSKIFQGQLHTPSLTRLIALPWAFWMNFLPSLAWILAKKNIGDISHDVVGSARRKA